MLVHYRDELDFGLTQKPEKWYSIAERLFQTRWKNDRRRYRHHEPHPSDSLEWKGLTDDLSKREDTPGNVRRIARHPPAGRGDVVVPL